MLIQGNIYLKLRSQLAAHQKEKLAISKIRKAKIEDVACNIVGFVLDMYHVSVGDSIRIL